MKLFPIADFHAESHWKQLGKYRGNADVIIVAGDFHTKTDGPAELRRIFGNRRIIYVSGNHEYYGSILRAEDERLRKACKNQGIDYLQCDAVEIDGINIIGCTFWTDFRLFGEVESCRAEAEVARYLNDYRVIYSKNRLPITTAETLELHRQHKAWLIDQFEVYRGKPLVVVTHHGPSKKCVHPDYTKNLASAGFASDLDCLVKKSGARYWICGHSHVGQHFTLGKTEVWMNCKGYSGENVDGFNPWLELEL